MRQHDTYSFQDIWIGIRRGAAVLAVVSLGALVAACGGGGSDDEGDGGDSGSNVDFAGTWSVTETVADTCGAGNYTETYTIVITGQDDEFVMDDGADEVDLEIDGDTMSWSYQSTEDGYTVSMQGTATVSGDTFTGSSEWEITGDEMNCGGTATFSGTRVSGGDDGGDGDGDGDGSAGDGAEIEPNETPENATVIALSGTSVTFTGETPNDEDYDLFAFTPPAGDTYTITLQADNNGNDIDLWLADSNYNVLDASEGDFGSEEITVELSAGLVYYIEVVAYEIAGDDDYTLTITRN